MELDIVFWPDPVLLRPADPVGVVDEEVRAVAAGMRRVMFRLRGVGLAAPQVGVSRRIMIVCPSGAPGEEEVVLDPEILERHGEAEGDEGCLSLPGVYGPVVRAERVRVRFRDLDGRTHERELEDFAARVFQHEHDHLEGIMFPERMTPAARAAIEEELEAFRRSFAERGAG
jgi:peptide deformylase